MNGNEWVVFAAGGFYLDQGDSRHFGSEQLVQHQVELQLALVRIGNAGRPMMSRLLANMFRNTLAPTITSP